MRIKKLLVFVSMIVVIATLMCAIIYKSTDKKRHLTGVTEENFSYVIVPADENEGLAYDIKSSYRKDQLVLFLPCTANPSSMIYYAADEEGNYLERYENDFSMAPGLVLDIPVICMQSDLPTVEIKIDDRYASIDEVEKDELHEVKAYGDMTVTVCEDVANANGWDTIYQSHSRHIGSADSMSIKGRGQSSWIEDKKPYIINLEEDVSILGMGSGEKWVLLANVVDHSLLRNEVFYNLAEDCDVLFAPQIRQVDLFIDGEYKGNYSLCPKVEIGPERVNINEKKDYFYRLGLPTGVYEEFDSKTLVNDNNYVELINPGTDDFNADAFDKFEKVFAEIENPAGNLSDVDLESFAKYYWIQEFAKNLDSTSRSVYLYWNNEEGRMYMVSSWDMDRTAGTIEPINNEHNYIITSEWSVRYEEWFDALFKHREFEDEVERVYREYGYKDKFRKCADDIPMRIDHIRASADMNFMQWDYLERPLENYYNFIEYYMGDSSYNSETEWLKEWISQRADWIAEQMESN